MKDTHLRDLTPDSSTSCTPFLYLLHLLHPLASFHHNLKELELYKEELVSKPALLVVNKMDLPDAEDKLAELKEQLQNPDGRFDVYFYMLRTSCGWSYLEHKVTLLVQEQ